MLPVNPPPSLLGTTNALWSARARWHEVRAFPGPLSVKSVVAGAVAWETGEGRYALTPGAALVLNDGEPYSMELDALQPVETFCVFFARGFVEDAWRASTSSSSTLLDDARAPSLVFHERLHHAAPLVDAMRALHARRDEESLYAVAHALVATRGDVDARIARLPALRATTRAELARRVARGTSFLHANLGRAITVDEAARAACLSPFHFARLFASFHGVTPHRYLTQLRIAHARTLLRNGNASVADVAAACGFASVTTFTALFSKWTGTSPRRFSQDRRNADDAAALR